MVDNAALRTKMVDGQVRPNDVTDHRIIDAMLEIPREDFVPASQASLAYLDRDLPSAPGRAMLQPMTVARLVQAARIGAADRVLVVGAGSGYLAAVTARLAAAVVALEEHPELAAAAGAALARHGQGRVTVATGPLAAGWPGEAPYDVIVVEGAVEVLPEAIAGQLADGGRLVVVEGIGQSAVARLYTRSGGEVAGRVLMNAAAPLLPGFSREPAFVF